MRRRDALRLLAGGTVTAALGTAAARADIFPLPPPPLPPTPGTPGLPSSPANAQSVPLTKFVEPLPVPHMQQAGGTLTARRGTHRFHPDLPSTTTWGYGDQPYLGPTLEAQADTPAEITFRNELGRHVLEQNVDVNMHGASEFDRSDPRMNVHLHGAPTHPASDGHPLMTVRNGGAITNSYANRQEAATLWYHDHSVGITRLNVPAGLAGLYLVRDRYDTGRANNPLGLPAGEFEAPLILQDKILQGDGSQNVQSYLYVPPDMNNLDTFGDVAVVNGAAWPKLQVARGLYRLRLLNASNFRVYNLYFGNRMRFWVIGTDQGLLDTPAETSKLRFAPGERADILVDFGGLAAGESVTLLNETTNSPGNAFFQTPALPEIMRFDVGTERPQLPLMLSLNNLPFATDDVELVRPGPVEQWDLVNDTAIEHPIHIHLARFRVLGRQLFSPAAHFTANQPVPPFGTRWNPPADLFALSGMREPEPWERGWRDMVLAPVDHITRILVYWPTAEELGFDPDEPFAPIPDPHHDEIPHDYGAMPQTLRGYVWHCHVLDHEDHDMMLPLRVTGS